MKSFFGICCMLFVIFLTGCNQEVVTNVSLTSIQNVQPEQFIRAKSFILYEVPSEKEFKRTLPLMKEIFGKYMNVKEISFKTRNMEGFGAVECDVPICVNMENIPFNSLFYFRVSDHKLFSTLDNMAFNEFKNELSQYFSNNMGMIPLRDIKFMIILSNDTGQDVQLTHYSCFVDGLATAFSTEKTMDSNSKYIIQMSNVFVDEMETMALPILSWK